MNVFCVAQAVNTALSFCVMLSGILYKCLYTVCDCLSAQCSCPVYPRPKEEVGSDTVMQAAMWGE